MKQAGQQPESNYAFVDSQNVNLGVQELGWKLDFKKFRVYLAEKYAARSARKLIFSMTREASSNGNRNKNEKAPRRDVTRSRAFSS